MFPVFQFKEEMAKKGQLMFLNKLSRMVTPVGFEPTTSRSVAECSIQLSHGAIFYYANYVHVIDIPLLIISFSTA